jgi:membrane-bound lytic murein transglycosylase D
VDGVVDERTDLRKSTHAACRFLRKLILEFGNGSSVMLALAAYNLGPAKVRQAVAKTVEDPIQQRNFWYLYRIRALPAETREYVPKVFAAIIIARNPELFGFQTRNQDSKVRIRPAQPLGARPNTFGVVLSSVTSSNPSTDIPAAFLP